MSDVLRTHVINDMVDINRKVGLASISTRNNSVT